MADDAVAYGAHGQCRWPRRRIVACANSDRCAPEVEFTQPPKNQGRGLLRVEFEAMDDFGLAKVDMIIRNPEGWPVPGGNKELEDWTAGA